jgi:carboxyl-terminal processing protease
MTHVKHISSSRGLILDLRSNGGGNTIVSMSIFSLFVSTPSIFEYSSNVYDNQSTIVVKPHPGYYIDNPVVILVDKGTACAAESFAEAMRCGANAIIMGKDERTSGVYANVVDISFPSGIILKTNIFSEQYRVASREQIENRGIKPDILIDINRVKDLFPYDDKCLQSACQYINHINFANTRVRKH